MSPFSSSRRRRFAAGLLAALAAATAALGLSSCGEADQLDQYAAVVNGREISVDTIQTELREIARNDDYVASIEAANVNVRGQGEGTFDSAFVAQVVTRAIAFELVAQELEERGAQVTEDDIAVARESVSQQVGGPEVFDQFSEAYRRSLAERTARVSVLQRVLSQAPVGEGAARAFYEENPEEFAEACAHHILVETQEEAQQVIEQLRGGASFEELARAQSIDTGSGEQGGDLGCAPRGVYVPEFEEAVFEAPVGEVVGPVETTFGFHVIRVDERTVPPFEEIEAQVEARLAQQSQGAFSEWIQEAFDSAEVEVNPRFGSWSPGFQPQVVPPDVPTTIARNGEQLPEVPLDPLLPEPSE